MSRALDDEHSLILSTGLRVAEPEEGNVGVMAQSLGRGTVEGQNGVRLAGVQSVKNLNFPQPQASRTAKRFSGRRTIADGPRFASAKRRGNYGWLCFTMIFAFGRCVPDGWSVVSLQRNGRGITAGCVLQ